MNAMFGFCTDSTARAFGDFCCPSISIDEGISLIEQHGEEHAEGLIGIVEAFEDSAAGTAGGRDGILVRTASSDGRSSWVHNVHSLF